MPHTGNTNQQNAQHSTGPITEAGKAASSKNSFRHGLTSSAMIMVNGESIADFIEMANTFLAEHNPVTITEETLVTQMIDGVWLGRRAAYLQQNLILGDQAPDEKKLALYMRYQAMHLRNFHKAHNELRRIRKEDRAELQKEVQKEAQKEAGFVSQTVKQDLLVAKVRQLNIRSEAGQVAIEHGKIRNARLLAASAAASTRIELAPTCYITSNMDARPRKCNHRRPAAPKLRLIPNPQNARVEFVFNRVIWIVLDSVGAGAMPDAASYGDDPSSDTLGNIDRVRGLQLPNLARLGLGNLKALRTVPPAEAPAAAFGRAALASPGKDTTTGHWEMVGIHLDRPFPLFPHGFPPEVMHPFETRIGRAAIGNKAASGTEILVELGEEHMRTGSPIVYTSADSVFQIAAHEDVIPLWELQKICETAREILRGPFEVGRVIARPFTGIPGTFARTPNRHDYAVPPPKGMLLDQLYNRGVEVYSVGKIFDVFLGRGIGDHVKSKNNAEGMRETANALSLVDQGLIFTNLVDFDQQYGHRNDVEGYAKALEEFDRWLPDFLAQLKRSDLLLITADHGCDPTTISTDHSREYVPVLAYGPKSKPGVSLGLRDTLSDLGQTVADIFGTHIQKGASFLPELV